jgi:hypothetical protein
MATTAAVAAGVAGVRPVANTLSAALSQTNQFLEGNAVVNRHTSVMFSREVLVFYVDRRSYVYTAGTTLTNLARLPTSIAGFERINDIALQFEPTITINYAKDESGAPTDAFNFCSAVVADVNTSVDPSVGGNYVVGSSAIVFNPNGSSSDPNHFDYYHYTPNTCITRNSTFPVVPIDFDDDPANDKPGVQTLVSKRAVILVYTNPGYKDTPISF